MSIPIRSEKYKNTTLNMPLQFLFLATDKGFLAPVDRSVLFYSIFFFVKHSKCVQKKFIIRLFTNNEKIIDLVTCVLFSITNVTAYSLNIFQSSTTSQTILFSS